MKLKKITTTTGLIFTLSSPAPLFAYDPTYIFVCKTCNPGTYSDGTLEGSCADCNLGTCSLAGASSCMNCKEGTSTSSNGTSSSGKTGTPCNSSDGKCIPCSPGYYADQKGLSTCKECSAGTVSNTSGATGCTGCGKGKYAPNKHMSQCNDVGTGYCATGSANTGRSGCSSSTNSGTYPGVAICNKETCGAVSCNGGYILSGTSCSKCGKGTFTSGGTATQCTSCNDGYCQPDVGQTSCTRACVSGGISSCNKTTCAATACKAGYGGSTCTACSNGKYSSGGSGALSGCSSCSSSSYSSWSSEECGTITRTRTDYCTSSGSTSSTANSSKTTETSTRNCSSGFSCSNSLCYKNCSSNATRSADRKSCSCNAGYAGDGVTCNACNSGKYQDKNGQSSCKNCSDGEYSGTSGAKTSCSSCLSLSGYQWSSSGSSSCHDATSIEYEAIGNTLGKGIYLITMGGANAGNKTGGRISQRIKLTSASIVSVNGGASPSFSGGGYSISATQATSEYHAEVKGCKPTSGTCSASYNSNNCPKYTTACTVSSAYTSYYDGTASGNGSNYNAGSNACGASCIRVYKLK